MNTIHIFVLLKVNCKNSIFLLSIKCTMIIAFLTVSSASPLTGQVAVITGASSGIGRETALILAKAGAAVSLGARSIDVLQEVVKEIEGNGGKALAVQTDVTKRDEVTLFGQESFCT